MSKDTMRSIRSVQAQGQRRLLLEWSDGTTADILLADDRRASGVEIGEWGHSIVWPDGFEMGADALWLETLDAAGRGDVRQFLEWRLANALSLAKAAEALGLARRTVAYYSNGDRPVPKAILLACKGWDAVHAKRRAA